MSEIKNGLCPTEEDDGLLAGRFQPGALVFGTAVGPGFLGSHRGPENNDHGSAHEGHAAQNEQIEKERGEDAGAVHDPVLAQISAEGQVLCGALGGQAFGSCGHEQR